MDSVSVFDLSPAEKLQLVEDLWDDLASAPEAVLVLFHDWQRQELARRKTNPLKKPGFGPGLGRGEAQGACPPCPLSWRSLWKPSRTLQQPTSGMEAGAADRLRSS
jgi:putative addiction module component (TIGR02574 family)